MRAALKTLVLRTVAIGGLLAAAAWPQSDSAGLERVLNQMDAAARNFRTTEASLVSDQYQKVINESETAKYRWLPTLPSPTRSTSSTAAANFRCTSPKSIRSTNTIPAKIAATSRA